MQKIRTIVYALAAFCASVAIAYAVNITGANTQNETSILRMGYARYSNTDNITAFAGGGQASATLLDSAYNRVTTVATAADSVKLPSCQTGANPTANTLGVMVYVTNADSTDSMNVFPQTGQAINALSANAAYAMAAGKTSAFLCGTAGVWYSILGG